MKKRKSFPVYLAVILVIMYLPIMLVILYSFNDSKISSLWTGFTFSWYRELFMDRSMFSALLNSVILALLASSAAAIIGTLGASGMARARETSRRRISGFAGRLQSQGGALMEFLSILPIMTPEIIMGMVFLAFFSLLSLPFGMLTLVIAHTAFCVPYVYLLVRARLAGLDKSYVEAARIMGAGDMRAFYDITLPLVLPAVISGMLISFAMSFDDVIISVFVSGPSVNTLPMKIYSQLKVGVTPKVNAMCTLIFLFTVLLCFISAALARRQK
ncbi:MAG: ABC transporter permease [Treponema sp.]|nr:ABC transporter permease [Treponema sp.]